MQRNLNPTGSSLFLLALNHSIEPSIYFIPATSRQVRTALLLTCVRGRKPGSKSEVPLLGSRWHNKSVVDGGTEADCVSLSHQSHHETVLSPLLLLRDSMSAKYKEYLLVQGWSWYFHSGNGMNVLSSLHNTDCQLQQILAYSSAISTVRSSLPSNAAGTCTLLSSLGFCRVLSGHHSALVTLRATSIHLSRALETRPFTSFPGFK